MDQDPLESTDSMVCAFASVVVVGDSLKRRSAAPASSPDWNGGAGHGGATNNSFKNPSSASPRHNQNNHQGGSKAKQRHSLHEASLTADNLYETIYPSNEPLRKQAPNGKTKDHQQKRTTTKQEEDLCSVLVQEKDIIQNRPSSACQVQANQVADGKKEEGAEEEEMLLIDLSSTCEGQAIKSFIPKSATISLGTMLPLRSSHSFSDISTCGHDNQDPFERIRRAPTRMHRSHEKASIALPTQRSRSSGPKEGQEELSKSFRQIKELEKELYETRRTFERQLKELSNYKSKLKMANKKAIDQEERIRALELNFKEKEEKLTSDISERQLADLMALLKNLKKTSKTALKVRPARRKTPKGRPWSPTN